MVTAALWYKSASGRGDAPESNAAQSEHTQGEERGGEGRPRGLQSPPTTSLHASLLQSPQLSHLNPPHDLNFFQDHVFSILIIN